MKLTKLLFEAPIEDFKTVGDFSKSGSGWDKKSSKLLNNPVGIEKIKQKWSKTPYAFNMYMIKKVGASKFSEVGTVDKAFLQNELGLDVNEFKLDTDDAITVFYTNNTGDEKVPMTAWIMAHRFAHAIMASTRKRDSAINASMRAFEKGARDLLVATCNAYRVKPDQNTMAKAASLVGTFKSARENNIRNDFEFVYELLAQYLITGTIKLNPLPESSDVFSRSVFGRKDSQRGTSEEVEEFNDSVEMYARDMQHYADDVLSSCQNKIFVM